MFRNKVVCPSCNNKFDALEDKCPNCHNENESLKEMKLSKYSLNLPLVFQVVFFLFGWLGLQFIAGAIEIVFLLFNGPDLNAILEANNLAIIQFSAYGALSIGFTLLIVFSKSVKKFINPFKNYKTYYFGFLSVLLLLGLSNGYGGLISDLNVGESGNQSLIIEITKGYPVLSIIFLCFLGPICEELTYRVGLFTFLRRKSKVLAYLVTIFVFAVIHFDITQVTSIMETGDVSGLINELLNFPSYLIGAFVLTITYDRYGFGASSIAHILNNLFGIIIIIVQNAH